MRAARSLAFGVLAILATTGTTLRANAQDAPAPGSGPAAPPAVGAPARPPAPPPKPAPPPTPEQAADAVLASVAARDDAAIRALAASDDFDPWIVADELIRRGQHDVADAFARAAPRADKAALPAYVASRRGMADDPARRERIRRARAALQAGAAQEALDTLGSEEAPGGDDVVGSTLAMGRGTALRTIGAHDRAWAAFRSASDVAERLGWLARAAHASDAAARAAYAGGALADAQVAWARAVELADRRGDRGMLASMTGNLGIALFQRGRHDEARAAYERAIEMHRAVGNEAGVASTLSNLGNLHMVREEYVEALAIFRDARASQLALGDAGGAAITLGNVGIAQRERGDLREALTTLERARAEKDAVGNTSGAAGTLAELGKVRTSLGDVAGARAAFEQALATQRRVGDRRGAAVSRSLLADLHRRDGRYAEALTEAEAVLAEFESLGQTSGVAMQLGLIAKMRLELGDRERAAEALERSIPMLESLGMRTVAASNLRSLGHAYRGDPARAAVAYERARALAEASGDRREAARAAANLAFLRTESGDPDRGVEALEAALATQDAIPDPEGASGTRNNLGLVLRGLGRLEAAAAMFERAAADRGARGERRWVAGALANLAGVQLRLSRPRDAVASARRALEALDGFGLGFAADEALEARASVSFVFSVGARAAAATNEVPELCRFLEIGRGGTLLEAIAAREALWSAAVPAALRADEAEARSREARAAGALRRALDTGDLAATRARRTELDAARGRVAEVVARIQREAKAAAAIVYPEAATLDELRATLDAGDVLVLYGLFEEADAAALVVERDGARIVTLGPRAPIDAAAEAAAEALADGESDPAAAITTLADLVGKPLALREGTKRVLVSPAGALSYVPFAALLPNRTVAYVPSGTTYRLLREEEVARGEGVLALGDPDYETKVDERALALNRGPAGRLVRLPATRDEALAIGTKTLLGAAATEAGLRTALAERKRWRAVHLACHGLVNTERPALSSLAITAAGDDDGFLTCLDVFRMNVPSDLVVLSACETGKGKIVGGEGIVGLTRAFMYAGSPRVICSLWKVDDAATAALMKQFYELWNPKDGTPGLPTAEALRRAQEHVRSQEKWKHPYYGAAWVLWGLPS